jgi:hypothetical protein
VKAINERQVSDSDIQNLCLALGKYFYDVVSEDIKNISRMYKNYDALFWMNITLVATSMDVDPPSLTRLVLLIVLCIVKINVNVIISKAGIWS